MALHEMPFGRAHDGSDADIRSRSSVRAALTAGPCWIHAVSADRRIWARPREQALEPLTRAVQVYQPAFWGRRMRNVQGQMSAATWRDRRTRCVGLRRLRRVDECEVQKSEAHRLVADVVTPRK